MLPKLISNTRLRIASVLVLIWVVYLIFNFTLRAFFLPLFSVTLVAALDLITTYVRKRALFLPASSLVTGFLIGLILSPEESILPFALAAAFAVFSKQFVRAREHQHVFNPAAFGIFGASLLTGVPVAWWAVSWSPWVIFLIVSVSYTLYALKRLWLPVTFLITYGVFVFVTAGSEGALSSLLDGTVMLFAFIMLPEPITSPIGGRWKYFFGPLIAVLTILVGKVGVVADVFLPALLLGNLVGFLTKRIPR